MGERLTIDTARFYYLWPRGPMRFGTHAGDLTASRAFPSSDTLFGALAWAYAARFGRTAVEEWIKQFQDGAPPVLISSALPVLDSGQDRHVLVPLPVRAARRVLDDRKYLKRVRYLEPSLLAWLDDRGEIAQSVLGECLLTRTTADRVTIAFNPPAEARSKRDEVARVGSSDLWSKRAHDGERPRVTVDRLSGASALFASSAASYARTPAGRVGLAIGVQARDPEQFAYLDACFDVLGATGIGGERSVGYGGFTWECVKSPLTLSTEPRGMLVSLCCPQADELASDALNPETGTGYRVTERAGWIGSSDWPGYRGRPVGMLAEGSYVNRSLRGPVGGMADVTPEDPGPDRHRVFRYGYGLFLDEGSV